MRPNDYDAHLGLALALRGQIDDSNYDKQVAAVQAELDACKKLDAAPPRRLLQRGHPHAGVQGEGRRRQDKTDRRARVRRRTIFQQFIDKAAGKPEYDGAVKKAKERMQDIDDTITFLKAGGPPTPSRASGTPSDSSGGGNATPAPRRERRACGVRERRSSGSASGGQAVNEVSRNTREPSELCGCQTSRD